MVTLAAVMEADAAQVGVAAERPRILVLSTNAISDPGIDLAGSSHLHYPPEVVTVSLPCTSGIRPEWIVHALDEGFAGVFIAADGEECAYLPDCTARSARIVQQAQALMAERGINGGRVRMAAICSVCAEVFVRQVRDFAAALGRMEVAA